MLHGSLCFCFSVFSWPTELVTILDNDKFTLVIEVTLVIEKQVKTKL